MPAKKPRRISKQNKEIIRRNYNKKIIQLNRLIYELSWYSSEVNLQREFIQNFFNKQIDYSISVYRNQVKKLQDSSIDDYNFIVERTDRFYQRKYQKLNETENDNYPKISEEVLNFEKNVIDEECNNLRQNIIDINQQIANEQKKFEEEIRKWQLIITEKVKEEKEKGKKAIDVYLIEFEKQYIQYQTEFEEKMKMLQKIHEEELDKTKNEKLQTDFHIDTSYSHNININEYINTIEMMQNQHKSKLSELKNQITNEINNIMNENDSHQNKYKNYEKNIVEQIDEMDQNINNLISLFKKMKDRNNSDIIHLQQEFENLQNQNKEIINDKSKLTSNNTLNDLSSIDYLIKSLRSKLDIFKQKMKNEKQNKECIIESISQDIEKSNNDLNNQITELIEKLNIQKAQHNQTIESYQKEFISEKENMSNLYKEKIDKLSNSIQLFRSNKDQAKADYESVLNNLQSQKDFLISENLKELTEIDKNTENEINQINNDHILNKQTIQRQFNEMIEKDKLFYSSKIEEVERQNKEKIELLKKQKENEYQLEIDLIKNDGYSKSEYERIEKSFKDEFDALQIALNESSVITPQSDLFKNMARVISDLQSELKDHEVIIQSRGRCLKFEWQEKIRKENERFARSPFNDKAISNPRARDQMKNSYQSKINEVIKEKNEALSKLNDSLNQMKSKRDDDVEIINLQNDLNQLDNQKNSLIQKAILDKDKMINNKKEQINRYQSEFGTNKRDMLNKINDQKIEFNSIFKKLNDSLVSAHQIQNQAEREEINSFQSRANIISFQFCERKRQLVDDINELNSKSSSVSLSSSISSSSSSSSLISQETKDAWTKQRKDLDAKVQRLRDQISSEIAELNSQKKEISKNLDSLWKEKLDHKMKLMKIMSNWSPKSSDAEHIAKLELTLKSVTIQLTNTVNEMKKYKNLYMDQERQINKKIGAIPDVGLLQ